MTAANLSALVAGFLFGILARALYIRRKLSGLELVNRKELRELYVSFLFRTRARVVLVPSAYRLLEQDARAAYVGSFGASHEELEAQLGPVPQSEYKSQD